MSGLAFRKMHGLGNDFVVIDGRADNFEPTEKFLRALANRKRGVGCDQIIVLRMPNDKSADVHMDIYNMDGSNAGACGNATRCIASLMFKELNRDKCTIETVAGLLKAWRESECLIAVDLGAPHFAWNEIPLARDTDTLKAPVSCGELSAPCCVNVGNPHAVFFVADVNAVDLPQVGPKLEHDPMFPQRCNIEMAQVLSRTKVRMRVWERGTGVTEACGTGACATLLAAARRGLTERRATIVLDGGELVIDWREDNHVILIGPAALSFTGTLAEGFGDDGQTA